MTASQCFGPTINKKKSSIAKASVAWHGRSSPVGSTGQVGFSSSRILHHAKSTPLLNPGHDTQVVLFMDGCGSVMSNKEERDFK